MDFNCIDWLKSYSDEERRDINNLMANDIAILCLNVQGDANLGNMIRTACLFGCKTFYLAGRKKWDKRYSVGAHHYMDVVHLPELYDVRIDTHHPIDCKCGDCKTLHADKLVEFLKTHNYTPCFIEQGGTPVVDAVWKKLTERPIFIYGNESNGIPPSALHYVQQHIPNMHVLSVPQHGIMRSHNVSSVCTIVLWEYMRHSLSHNML
jgi:tRNA G18 (ribose-2'-O)-methylase SpoU